MALLVVGTVAGAAWALRRAQANRYEAEALRPAPVPWPRLNGTGDTVRAGVAASGGERAGAQSDGRTAQSDGRTPQSDGPAAQPARLAAQRAGAGGSEPAPASGAIDSPAASRLADLPPGERHDQDGDGRLDQPAREITLIAVPDDEPPREARDEIADAAAVPEPGEASIDAPTLEVPVVDAAPTPLNRRRGRRNREPSWIGPSDDRCPDSHPIKVRLASRLFHLPGMVSYDRTRPDRCYQSGEKAEADGFTQAKR